MSKVDNETNSLIKIEVPKSIDNALNNLTDKPTETLGQVLSDCLFLVFGGLNQKAELKRAKYAFELKEFSKELESKVESIPENKRREPNIHTVCTALDSMKYCVEEPQLREMFSTLISNSMNVDVYKSVHPSYGEIIRQMTPQDAKLLSWIKDQMTIAAIKFNIRKKGGREFAPLPMIYIEYNSERLEAIQVSLENLSRLKIIDFNFKSELTREELYERIRETEIYLEDKSNVESQMEDDMFFTEEKGSITVSQFGSKFIEACC